MPDGASIATVVSISISVGMIITCGYIANSICNDINGFYEDAMKEFHTFQELTDDAWTEVMSVHRERTPRSAFDRLIGAGRKRRDLPEHCNCLAESNCPAGPPGAPGKDGNDGDDGAPGMDGPHGVSATSETYEQADGGCIKCPAGVPGPKGRPGPPGMPGARGHAGYPGEEGADGPPGQPGPPGDDGQPGKEGAPGEMGKPGENGIRYLPSPRGPPGMPGPMGPPGPAGPGGVAEEGPDGLPGPQGKPGLPGMPGPIGPDGEPGMDGIPGFDAEYCPCPPRGEQFVKSSPQESEDRSSDYAAESIVSPKASESYGAEHSSYNQEEEMTYDISTTTEAAKKKKRLRYI